DDRHQRCHTRTRSGPRPDRGAQCRADGNEQRCARAVFRTGRAGRGTPAGIRAQDPVPVVHEPRVPHAAGRDPEHGPAADRTAGRPADRGAGAAGHLHPGGRRRVERDGGRPARPRESRGRAHHRLARLVRADRPVFGAARHVQTARDQQRGRGAVRGARGRAADVLGQPESRADPAQLHLERLQVHRARHDHGIGARRGRHDPLLRRRHRHRYPRGGAGPAVRGLRAGPVRTQPQRARDRAGPVAVPALRGAARRVRGCGKHRGRGFHLPRGPTLHAATPGRGKC
ncbi:MAG: Putative SigmaB asociated two-component system sensor protein, partial [uncultured Lysobacter sp.]